MSIPLPSPHWQWHFDQAETHLCLSLGEQGVLKTALSKKVIRDIDFCFGGFSVSDTEIYQQFYDAIESGPLANNVRFAFMVLINAIAAIQFHKEVAAKNWFFEAGVANEGPVIPLLQSVKTKLAEGDVMVTNPGAKFSTCILLQDLQLNDIKCLPVFTLIKVGNDRLFNFTGQCLDFPAQHE